MREKHKKNTGQNFHKLFPQIFNIFAVMLHVFTFYKSAEYCPKVEYPVFRADESWYNPLSWQFVCAIG